MVTNIKTLLDRNGDVVLPRTRTSAVTIADGSLTVDEVLDSKAPHVHTHTKGDITDFNHSHLMSEVANLESSFNSVQARFNEIFVNVKDFGATGDGATDDTVAIQNALNSFSSILKGGVLFFPRGTYMISSTLRLPISNTTSVPIRLCGDNGANNNASTLGVGSTPTILRATVDGFTMIDLTDAVESRVSFENLTLWGFYTGTEFPGVNSFGIKANKFTGGRIINCTIRGFEVGVDILGEFYYSMYRDNYIRDCRVACMRVGLVNGSTIMNSHFRDSLNAVGLHLLTSGRSVNIVGCWFEQLTIGIKADGVRQLNCFGTYFEHCSDCHVRLQYLDEGRYGVTGNFFGCSFRLNTPTTNCIKSTVSGGGVIINLSGCTYALSDYNQTTVVKTVVGSAGGTTTFAPYVYSLNTYPYQITGALLPIEIAPATWPNKIIIDGGRFVINNNLIQYSNVIPTSGSYRIGDRVYRTNPAPGGNEGWVCTETGSPGTWKSFGSISV